MGAAAVTTIAAAVWSFAIIVVRIDAGRPFAIIAMAERAAMFA